MHQSRRGKMPPGTGENAPKPPGHRSPPGKMSVGAGVDEKWIDLKKYRPLRRARAFLLDFTGKSA